MSTTICFSVMTLNCPSVGGHRWVYLNWALGLRALGCRVIWLESTEPNADVRKVWDRVASLKEQLRPYGLDQDVALKSWTGEPLPEEMTTGCLNLDAAASEADLLLNQQYDAPASLVRRFRRSALLDIDPGLLQTWVSGGHLPLAPHDVYFTTGETVGQPTARVPDLGLRWVYTPPCVSVEWWTPHPSAGDAPLTTVSSWHGGEWMEDETGVYENDKRTGFEPFLDLPRRTEQPLELALSLSADESEDRAMLQERGWGVRESDEVAGTPGDYQHYVQGSRGEFSCVKPSCVRLQNAWISDRTLCYLASGKPAIVQHTGPSRFLPDAEGLFRFRTLDEAVRCVESARTDYERHCGLARQLAEEFFDACKVAMKVLEGALP